MSSVRERYGEAFWRAHHEAWLQSELNQREYCEAYGVPLKAFGNWRAKFKAEPQTPARKVLYRRGGLSHTLSHGLSHDLSIGPIIPPAREGRRRMFGSLFYLVRNRFYVGEVKYKDEILPGEQPAIVDRALFDAVQQKLTDQWTTRSTTRNASDQLLT